ncbi:unnamed protein product [Trichobilharzia regenti]|nr:unnamed protein product [Trichobilharzia regenti]
MMDVTKSRICPKCRVSFCTDDEFWRHNLSLDCDDSKSVTAAKNMLSRSQHSNDETRLVCAPVNSSHIHGVSDFQNSTAQRTVDTQPQPTVRNSEEEIIRLLSRL